MAKILKDVASKAVKATKRGPSAGKGAGKGGMDLQLFAEGAGKSVFKSQELLDSHYMKHASEFGNITKEQYLKGAQNLTNPGGNILTKARSNGDILFYNKSTNEFAVKASDGTIRTYFKPTDGIDYFNRQK
jgi:pyocin large subunit-like protein